MTSSSDSIIGRVLHGTIEIIRLIGEGGMGHVYEGYQAHLDRKLAVKVLLPANAENPVAAEYFLREAKSSSQLRHPNIIEIIDFGKEPDDLLFLAMEFIPGKPLSALIEGVTKGRALETSRVVSIMTQTLGALEEAHAHHIIHRDLKPDNLMIERTRSGRDFVKVLDFGVAHLQGGEVAPGSLTQQGALLGTPHYMSPEQACGEPVDARSDLFSMGTILYEILTGELPFEGDKLPKLLMSVISQTPPSPSARAPKLRIHPQLEAICMRALQKDKQMRYQSARAFREALEDIAVAEPAPAHDAPKFIFKRASMSFDEPSFSETLFEDTSEAAGEVPDSFKTGENRNTLSGELLNVGDLLATSMETSSVSAEPTPEKSQGLQVLQQGLSSLRADLVADRASVHVVALHQRSVGPIDPEAFIEQHERMDRILSDLCARWGGVLHARQGGFTTLLFGLPTPGPNDLMHAAQAALSLSKTLHTQQQSSMAYGLSLSYGDVVVPPGRGMAHVAGPPLDEAIEAARRARADEILVASESLHDRLSASFELGQAQADGHRPLLSLHDQDHLPRADEEEGALIGRDKQVAQLLSLLGRVLRSEGGVLVVHGPTGVGKSALIRHGVALAAERDLFVLQARHRFAGAQGIYDVFRQWLHQDLLTRQVGVDALARTYKRDLGLKAQYGSLLQALLEDRLAEVFGHQGSALAVAQEDSALVRVQAAWMAFVRALGAHNRALFVLDGVDPYDPFLETLIDFMTHTLTDQPVGWMVGVRTYKEDDAPSFPQGAALMRVRPLRPQTCMRYLRVVLPDLKQTHHERIARLSAGNLMQLREIVAALEATPEDPERALEQLGDALGRVHELLVLHFKRLPRNVQNVLGLLALLGDGVYEETIAALANPSWAHDEALNDAYDHSLIHVQEGARGVQVFFENPLMAQSIYKLLGARVRKQTHARAAAHFAQKAHPQADDKRALIRHLSFCGEMAQAMELAQQLIDSLTLEFSYEQAQQLIDETLALMTTHDLLDATARVRLLLRKARVLELQGQTPDALEVVKGIHRARGIPVSLAQEIELTLSALWLEQEDPSLIEGMLKRLIESTATDVQAGQQQALWLHLRAQQQLAKTYEKLGRFAHARATLTRVLDLIESHSVDPTGNPWGPSLVWGPLNQLGRLQLKEGHTDEAYQSFKLCMQVVQQARDPFGEVTVAANLGSLYVVTAAYKKAHQALKHAVDLARRSGQMKMLAKLKYNQGMLYLKINSSSLATEAFRESATLSQGLGWREGMAQASHQLKRLEASS